MQWKPSKLGIIVTLFGAFFALCEVYGTYGYFMDQQGGLDYVVLLGCGIAASVPFLPPFADAARRRKWNGLALSLWLALPLALIVVMSAALQRTGSATDEAQKSREKASAQLAHAQQTKAEAEAEIARLGTVRALPDIDTDLTRVKLNPRFASSAQCTDATAKASREVCAEYARLTGEKAKAVELAKHRRTLAQARATIAEHAGGNTDSLALRISSYSGGIITEQQVRLWQPLFVPILASWLAGALLTFGMRMDLHVDDKPQDAARTPASVEAPNVAPPEPEPVHRAQAAPEAAKVVRLPTKPPRPRINAKPVISYMATHVPEAPGERAEWGEMLVGFRRWCAQQNPPIPPMDAEAFGLALAAICEKADIRVMDHNGRVYCVNRKVVA